MVKNKLLSMVLAGAILAGGAALAFDGATAGAEVPPKEIESIPTPVEKNVSLETKFTDIDHHWAYNDIVSLEAIGMWEDLTDEFGPKKTVTGAELISALDKIFGFRGEPDLGLHLELEISRIEVAKAIEKSFQIKKLSVITTLIFPIYEDTKELTPEESSALSFVFNTGIMRGRTEDKFYPYDPITRAEMAVVLNRTLATMEYAEPMEENADGETGQDEWHD
ncbi:MAG: S-layer homology domain-containing protein [Bacillota bacterium]